MNFQSISLLITNRRHRAQEEKKGLLKLFEMLPPLLKNVKTQIKQLTNVVHYIAFLEMFIAIHESKSYLEFAIMLSNMMTVNFFPGDSDVHCPLLHSLFGPDFRKELFICSFLSSGTSGNQPVPRQHQISNFL